MSYSIDLQGKSALVTGSTSGIGLAMAKALAKAGASVMLNGFGDGPLLAKQLSYETGANVIFKDADLLQVDQNRSLVNSAIECFGKLDILVNNVGMQHVAPVDAYPADKWDQILALNLSSAFHCTAQALPGMKQCGWGRIINLSSAHGLIASPFKSAYIAAKHGMVGLTKTTALETATQGITCNAICPAFVRTELVEKQIQDLMKTHNMSEQEVMDQILLSSQPTKKFVEAEDIGSLAVFLCSPASGSITGASLPIDAGWTAR